MALAKAPVGMGDGKYLIKLVLYKYSSGGYMPLYIFFFLFHFII